MKKAIVIGASSGIGRQLAVLLAQNNYKVGITGRRDQLLLNLKVTNPDNFIVSVFDVTDGANLAQKLNQLVNELGGGLDLLILSSGTGKINPPLNQDIEQNTNAVNVIAFTTIACWAFNFFQQQGYGQFAAITSVAATRGSRHAPAYGASKAYQVNYLQGLRQKAGNLKLPIVITDVRPGFVDTAMAQGEGLFWVASVEKASNQIYRAIENKRNVVYITNRWRLVAFIFRLVPGWVYNRA